MVFDCIKIGTVSSVNPAKTTARVVFPDDDGLVSYDLQVLQVNSFRNTDFAMPDVGTDVVCAFLSSGSEEGFILGAVYTDGNPPPESSMDKRTVVFKDGTRISYDRATHTLSAEIGGTSIVADRQNVSVVAPTAISGEAGTSVSIKGGQTVSVEGGQTVSVTGGAQISLSAPVLTLTMGGTTMTLRGSGATIKTDTLTIEGNVVCTGDVTAGGISLQNHTHTGVHGETSAAH